MMLPTSLLLASWASLVQLGYSAPVARPEAALIEASLAKRSETGPEIGGANFPDPSVFQPGGSSTWYAFATRTIGSSIHIQVASSPDFNTWTIVKNADGSQKDALPNLPAWVDPGSASATWAPSVKQLPSGDFIMYYSATAASSPAQHCIGAATASDITGPYTPVGSSALICPLSQGGAIDPSGYYDTSSGNRYIVYKIDGNSLGHGGACNNDVAPYVATPIMIQQVSYTDGVTLIGGPTQLLNNNGASDQGIVEAPSLAKIGSTYVLFFSSGCFTTGGYTVSYATANSITGPYTRQSTPLFQTGTDGLSAPGGADIYRDGQHMVFHANDAGGRAMYTAEISVSGTSVSA